MNILIVTHYFQPDGGAAAVRLSYLARWLAERGHRVQVLTTVPHYPLGRIRAGYGGRIRMRERWAGVEIVRAWLWASPSPSIAKKLISQTSFLLAGGIAGLTLQRPDVVLIEAQPMPTGVLGRFIAGWKRAPYVLNVSDLWPDHLLSVGALSESSLIYRIARRIVDSGYRGARHIIALSPEWRRRIAERLASSGASSEKITALWRGVDVEAFDPQVNPQDFRQAQGFDPQERLISFIGTFATQYDFEAWLDVAAHFNERTDLRFVVIGGGTQAGKLAQRLQHDPRLTRLRWIDWLDSAQMPQAWAASYVTTWMMRPDPLYQGTLPAKMYEALAMGVPIVAAQAGEAQALLEASGAGVALPVGDVAGMVSALSDLLSAPQRRQQMAQAGRAYALAHFDFRQTAQIYERILLAVSSKI